MLFNSWQYIIFLVVVTLIYWLILAKRVNYRNVFILLISYLFYGLWDWKFLGLIFLSSLVDFLVGKKIFTSEKGRKQLWLALSLLMNLGLLLYFKYFNFFIDSWINLMSAVGFKSNLNSLNIILPVGISFYTFQTLSYSIDIYRGQLKPVKSPIQFFAYVSFFPQLVAGPIERAINLLPQFKLPSDFKQERFNSGIKLIIWGLFKKMVIADYCAIFANTIFDNYGQASSLELILGALFFGFQIYGDFSGYSDIAIGSARILGFDLMTNFKTPYFATTITDFWRRWHISLTTWFRDYIYIPLGGSRNGVTKTIINVWIIFLISGFWHGANWTFITWGAIHALIFMPYLLKWDKFKIFSHTPPLAGWLITFSIVNLAWIFFRSPDVFSAVMYLKEIFNSHSSKIFSFKIWYPIILIIIFLILEKSIGKGQYPKIFKLEHPFLRRCLLLFIIVAILFFSQITTQNEFIYFQF
jgi:alginate O-acetyltransferase complex protein AlgI